MTDAMSHWRVVVEGTFGQRVWDPCDDRDEALHELEWARDVRRLRPLGIWRVTPKIRGEFPVLSEPVVNRGESA